MTMQEVGQLRDLIDDLGSAMMTTQHGDRMRSRPMASQGIDEDGTMWFLTGRASDKAEEIRDDSAVNLTFADAGKNRYVSISGRARLVDDLAKKQELWSQMAKVGFSGPEDPNLVLIRVDVDGAEYWDGPSSKMVALYGWVKALVTGEGVDMGENKTLGGSATLR